MRIKPSTAIVLCGLLIAAPSLARAWEDAKKLERLRAEHDGLKRCNPAFGWRGTVRYSEEKYRSDENGPTETYTETGDISIHGINPAESYASAGCRMEFGLWDLDEVSGSSSGGGCRVDRWTATFLVFGDSLHVSVKPKDGVPSGCRKDAGRYGWGTSFSVELRSEQTRYTGENSEGGNSLSYMLTREPPDAEPLIEVVGPACACRNETLSFTGTTSQTGGTFRKFEVRSSGGSLPTISTNQGGDQPRLELRGSAMQTGRTEIVAVYARDREAFRSAPHFVSFCQIDKPVAVANHSHLERDDWFFGTFSGAIDVIYEATGWVNGKAAADDFEWSMGRTEDGLFAPSRDRGKRHTFHAPRMPTKNTSFGRRDVMARQTGAECDCKSEPVTVRLFFPSEGKKNPGGEHVNWLYYWRQTSAWFDGKAPVEIVSEIPIVDAGVFSPCSTSPSAEAAGEYQVCKDRVYVKSGGPPPTTPGPPGEPNRRGIDALATILRHEARHREDFMEWWGVVGPQFEERYSRDEDCDGDRLPNAIEEALEGCVSGLLGAPDRKFCAFKSFALVGHVVGVGVGSEGSEDYLKSYAAARRSCPQRPPNVAARGVEDMEINAYWSAWKAWPVRKGIGPADAEDWACPGKQTKACGK